MNRILEDYEKGKKFFLYTGRGPSGHTHIGHLVPWVFAKWLQEKFDVNMYFQLTDDEKFYAKPNLSLEDTSKFAYENALMQSRIYLWKILVNLHMRMPWILLR
jgi:tryptophanyl-tRNA synthetase